MNATRVATCLMSLVWAAGHTARSEEISGADAGWAAMKRCAAIAEDGARHACTDEALRKAGLLGATQPKSAETPPARPRAASPPTASPPTASPPAKDARQSFGLPPPPAPKPAPSEARLEVTLANVEQRGDGKLVLTTTDGAIWRQVESEPIRPLPAQGQTMTIARKSLGGFMCESANRVAFRCYRTR